MRKWLFENNRELSEVAYGQFVKTAGLDVPQFVADFATGSYGSKIDEDIAAARAAGITKTPSFVLGIKEGKTIKGERIVGFKSFEMFSRKIEELLAAHLPWSEDQGSGKSVTSTAAK